MKRSMRAGGLADWRACFVVPLLRQDMVRPRHDRLSFQLIFSSFWNDMHLISFDTFEIEISLSFLMFSPSSDFCSACLKPGAEDVHSNHALSEVPQLQRSLAKTCQDTKHFLDHLGSSWITHFSSANLRRQKMPKGSKRFQKDLKGSKI